MADFERFGKKRRMISTRMPAEFRVTLENFQPTADYGFCFMPLDDFGRRTYSLLPTGDRGRPTPRLPRRAGLSRRVRRQLAADSAHARRHLRFYRLSLRYFDGNTPSLFTMRLYEFGRGVVADSAWYFFCLSDADKEALQLADDDCRLATALHLADSSRATTIRARDATYFAFTLMKSRRDYRCLPASRPRACPAPHRVDTSSTPKRAHDVEIEGQLTRLDAHSKRPCPERLATEIPHASLPRSVRRDSHAQAAAAWFAHVDFKRIDGCMKGRYLPHH